MTARRRIAWAALAAASARIAQRLHAFRDAGTERAGIDFDRLRWPHGETGRALVHVAVSGGPRY